MQTTSDSCREATKPETISTSASCGPVLLTLLDSLRHYCALYIAHTCVAGDHHLRWLVARRLATAFCDSLLMQSGVSCARSQPLPVPILHDVSSQTST